MILAQLAGGYSIAHLLILFVVVIAVAGIVLIFVRNSGVPVPQWVYQVAGIVILAVVVIFAIRFLLSL